MDGPEEPSHTVLPDGRTVGQLKLLTGSTHQIRVQRAFIGCPSVGDALYGYRHQTVHGQVLRAWRLCFDQPRTGERMCFETWLPDRLESVLADLRKSR